LLRHRKRFGGGGGGGVVVDQISSKSDAILYL